MDRSRARDQRTEQNLPDQEVTVKSRNCGSRNGSLAEELTMIVTLSSKVKRYQPMIMSSLHGILSGFDVPQTSIVHIATTGEPTLFKEGESVMTEFTTHAYDVPRCVMHLIGMLK